MKARATLVIETKAFMSLVMLVDEGTRKDRLDWSTFADPNLCTFPAYPKSLLIPIQRYTYITHSALNLALS
jgi:hypothetical protein